MSVIEQEKREVAALNAKLNGARDEIKAKNQELNDLRNRVVKLEDKSVTEKLTEENASLKIGLATADIVIADLDRALAKAQRDLAAAASAVALVEAIKAV